MSQLEQYYSNHSRALKFPWSIYHRPLLSDLFSAIESIPNPEGSSVLVIGPGDFFEFQLLKAKGFQIYILDIDPRVIEDSKIKFSDEVKNYYLVDESFNGYPSQKFDFVYAKEVIEHIPNTNLFLEKLHSLGHEETLFWLSTPNYGDWTLPLIESTFLELVARLSGFTRKGIHPCPFGAKDLHDTFIKNHFQVEKTLKTPAKLALTIWAKIINENKGQGHRQL